MIGIYGGTFNPIHIGHLRAAEEVVEAMGLDRMLFVPSARPPHKLDAALDIASAQLRLSWVELAIRENPAFVAERLEVDRPGPSFLVDTLRALGARHGGAKSLVFVVGQDAFSEMGSWRTPREIFRLCHVVVTTRPPVLTGGLGDWMPDCVRGDFEIGPEGRDARHRESGTTIRQIAITPLEVSASAIRERIRSGRSIRYLVPESVRAAILASGAYARPIGGEAEHGNDEPRTATGADS